MRGGEKFLQQFSQDMRQAFPGMQGFSVTTLKRMRLFAQGYPDFQKGAQAVHQLPWGHIVLLIHKLNDEDACGEIFTIFCRVQSLIH